MKAPGIFLISWGVLGLLIALVFGVKGALDHSLRAEARMELKARVACHSGNKLIFQGTALSESVSVRDGTTRFSSAEGPKKYAITAACVVEQQL